MKKRDFMDCFVLISVCAFETLCLWFFFGDKKKKNDHQLLIWLESAAPDLQLELEFIFRGFDFGYIVASSVQVQS